MRNMQVKCKKILCLYQSDKLYDVDSNIDVYDLFFDGQLTRKRYRHKVLSLVIWVK